MFLLILIFAMFHYGIANDQPKFEYQKLNYKQEKWLQFFYVSKAHAMFLFRLVKYNGLSSVSYTVFISMFVRNTNSFKY